MYPGVNSVNPGKHCWQNYYPIAKPLCVFEPITRQLGGYHVKLGENESEIWRIKKRGKVARGQLADREGTVKIGGYGLHADKVGTDERRRTTCQRGRIDGRNRRKDGILTQA